MSKYNPKNDPQFQKPYIDVEEIREDTGRYRYVHGGFEGTETRFSFFFPVSKDEYKGKFHHFLAPIQGHEDASIGRTGAEDKIKFAIDSGAYFVETNMGVGAVFGPLSDPTIIYRASAACAEYSRVVAKRLYGEHHSYGYIYGGSGGGFKSTSCFENTDTWDGACPYIIGSPMAIPNMFTVRALAKRVLRHKLPMIADAVDAGGGDMYEGLTETEKNILQEATKMGFPPKVWFMYKTLDDGALPILTPHVARIDSTYYDDFWSLPGYEGSNKEGSAAKDRIRHKAAIKEIFIPDEKKATLPFEKPALRLSGVPQEDLYLHGTEIKFTGGKVAGYAVPLEKIVDDWVVISEGFRFMDILERLSELVVGDEVLLDNSDYIAMQYYHRHQVPDEHYEGFAQFLDEEGKPKYPKRPYLIGPMVAAGGAGSLQSGKFTGKMINVCTLLDESALPWNADWYAKKVQENFGDDRGNHHKLWFIDNALHDDGMKTANDLHLVPYLGALHQALLDVSDWVERGVKPPESTQYTVKEGQIYVDDNASIRKGVQPTIRFTVNGSSKAIIKKNETVKLQAEIHIPDGAGQLTGVWLAVDPIKPDYICVFSKSEVNGSYAVIQDEMMFDTSGTFFPVIKARVQRNGDKEDIFTQIENLQRARVVVE